MRFRGRDEKQQRKPLGESLEFDEAKRRAETSVFRTRQPAGNSSTLAVPFFIAGARGAPLEAALRATRSIPNRVRQPDSVV